MKSNIKMKNDIKLLGVIFFCIVALSSIILVVGLSTADNKASIENNIEIIPYYANKSEEVLYLSDINYLTGKDAGGANNSYAGWDEIRYDRTKDGKISLKIEGGAFEFPKGIWAHASSRITYDVSEYNYKYFTTWYGVNTSSSAGNGVKFSIYTSKDGKNWEAAIYQKVKLPKEEAEKIVVDLEGVKLLRLEADSNGSNGNDHSVYADAKLTNDFTEPSIFKSLDEYDEIIKSQFNGETDITGEAEFNLLKRQLIANVGQFTINSFYNANDDNKAVLDWLMSNQQALRYYIFSSKPLGNSYYKSLTQLSRLYRNYKDDFNNTEVTKYGTVLGDLYLRMAISLSLTHSTTIGLWMDNASNPESQSDSVRRYAIIKYMHKNNLFEGPDGMDYNAWFEKYTVEEMRYVMANNIDDQSMLWLNAYVRELIKKEGSSRLWPHKYIEYVWPNYGNSVYYAEENKEYFNDLFSVPDEEHEGQRIGLWDVVYTIPGGVDVPEYKLQIPRGTSDNKIYKVWMNMRNKFGTGAVCGGISKTGSNIRGVLGLPDAVVGQPGHAAHINYFKNSKGEGYWGIDNDVSGWAYTGSSALLGWASGPYASGYTGTYIPLAQEVVNHFDIYEQSQKFVYLANSYTDLAKKEEMYRKALEIQPLNLNAWYELILTYNASSAKTEEQYIELSREIAEALKYYPLPMYQMTNQIKPKLTSIEAEYQFTLLQTRVLKEASATPNNSTAVLQPSITRLMANYLLGQMDTNIATFSFDGENAGKILLSSRFDGNGVRWDYSIDGKKTWKEVSFSAEEEHKWQLTEEEIAAMSSANDLYIHIVGVNYSEENLYKIDIQESAGLPSTLFASDLENKLIGAVDSIEWKYNETDEWTKYKNKQPELTGDKSVIVRMGATGTNLASNSSVTYTFTEDVVNNKRKYIPVSHITLEAVSTEAVNQSGSALFAIDANYNTRWHSAWNGSDTERYITVKLDQPYNISAVEFVPAAGGNGKIYDGTVWGSMDGEHWIVISQKKGLTYTNATTTVSQAIDNIKSFDADVPQRVQYVKIVADRTNGNWFTARAFNFYEDTTVKIAANFTFDGANAGLISLIDSEYKDVWKYSIDGGNTWKLATGNQHQLSKNEIKNITSENGIKIQLAGDDTEYSINIKESEALVINPYVNDLENRLIGLTDVSRLEWKYSDEDDWTSYSDEEPIVKGNRTLQVRLKATGITLPSEALEYQFTEDNQTDKVKYIPIKHLSIHGYSTQSVDSKRPYYAPNAIDGTPNTLWHTDFRYSVLQQEGNPYLTIKLDSPRNISALEFIQKKYRSNDPDDIKNAIVYVSMDGENWVEAGRIENCPQDNELRQIIFEESVSGQYVKLEMETYGIFASVAMINLYEDISQITSHVSIKYDVTEKTNKSVTAELVSDKDITVINNNGEKTFTFTENGTFTFEYTDQTGEIKTAVAVVDWIDKEAPTGTINYSIRDVTNENVVVTLTTSEEVTITNNNGSNTYTFTENGEFTFEFVDAAGNEGTATANVTWINKNAPTGTIDYSTNDITNGDVVATLNVGSGIVITNNHGLNTYIFTENGTFTFEFVDSIGNRGTATATVNWIDKVAPTAKVEYSTTELTNKDVVVTLKDFSEDIEILNNNGIAVYTFTENGEFEFEIQDEAGNVSKIKAVVNNIDKVAPTSKVEYSTTELTNKDVVVTIKDFNEEVTILNNNGKDTYTFTENGVFTFEIKDKAGNVSKIEAAVNNIDKVAPTAKVEYSTTELTNKDVVVTIKDFNEEVTILNNNGKDTYTFTENGVFTFEIQDKAGNVSKIEAAVNNIDKVAPTAKVEYSTTELTNKDVVVTIKDFNEEVTILNNNGKDTYTFTENGVFTFEIQDKAGNISKIEAKVDNINKNMPTAEVEYSTTELTNKDVVVTLTSNEDITITNNNGSNTYTFKANGEFKFEFVNKAGVSGYVIAKVDWIDKTAPTAKVEYSRTELTNKDVVVTLKDFSEEVTILNNGGKDTYTFVENGTFTFEIQDKAGNISKIEATVNNIDKVAPTAKVEYSITELTNKDVVVILKDFSEEVTILNNNGSNTYTFTENGVFTFEIQDKAGNISKIEAKVANINKVAPTAKVEYSTTELTNKDVVVTLKDFSKDVTILNNGGKDTYVFTENGEFVFEIQDKAGNISKIKAIVNNIDKVAPTAKVEYNTTELTNKDVVATLKDFSEDVTILNNDGKATYTFTENGEFTFEFVDKAGNKGTLVTKVNWIIKEDKKDENQNNNNNNQNNNNQNNNSSIVNKPSNNNSSNIDKNDSNNSTETDKNDSINENKKPEENDTDDKNNSVVEKEEDKKNTEQSDSEGKETKNNNILKIIMIALLILIVIIIGEVHIYRKSNSQ